MAKDTITVVTAADDKYAPHAGAMLHSLFSSNPDKYFAVIFLHRPELSSECLEKLAVLCRRFGAEWRSHQVDPKLLSQFPMTAQYPQEAWYRLLLPSILPGIDRVLWLDADVIILRSIEELWSTRLLEYPIAAVTNVLPPNHWCLPSKLGVPSRRLYFNSGVMLLSLDRLRQDGAEEHFRNFANKFRDYICHADQDVMVSALYGRRVCLPLKWNVIVTSYYLPKECIRLHGIENYETAMKDPAIIHFTGGMRLKPWTYSSPHPYRHAYIRHRVAAGWEMADFSRRSFRDYIVRRMPLRPLVIMATLRRLQFRNFLGLYK